MRERERRGASADRGVSQHICMHDQIRYTLSG